MKITEPKTPYVRYNAETDTIEGGTFLSVTYDDLLYGLTDEWSQKYHR